VPQFRAPVRPQGYREKEGCKLRTTETRKHGNTEYTETRNTRKHGIHGGGTEVRVVGCYIEHPNSHSITEYQETTALILQFRAASVYSVFPVVNLLVNSPVIRLNPLVNSPRA
jgi:hypothetical protein